MQRAETQAALCGSLVRLADSGESGWGVGVQPSGRKNARLRTLFATVSLNSQPTSDFRSLALSGKHLVDHIGSGVVGDRSRIGGFEDVLCYRPSSIYPHGK